MSKQHCIFCLVVFSNLNLLYGINIPLRTLIPSTSTYRPSTLLLPPGFDSEKAPLQPMLYPYAVTSSGISTRSSTTSGWIPVTLNKRSDLPLRLHSFSTTANSISQPVPVLEDRISNDGPKYSSDSYKEGPVFESIVYGTWKPDPPLQPVNTINDTKQQQHNGNTSNTGSNVNEGLAVDGRVYNKTINRQHGGFIGHIQHKLTKVDRQMFSSSTFPPIENESQQFAELFTEKTLQINVKKQGRRKIRPTTSTTTEQNSVERSWNTEEPTTTKENIQHQQNVIEVNSTDFKLTEVAKQINESIKIKYNYKQISTHSIDMTTTADAIDDDDYVDNEGIGVSSTQWATKPTKLLITTPQTNHDDDTVEMFENISATRRSWPTDFIEDQLVSTDVNDQSMNDSDEFDFIDSSETDPLEIPLALSALNIPPSLWPKLPGNITKLGKPYEAESSAEEPALCVPITVREENMMNSRELVYIERVFCFPIPSSSTTAENSLSTLESTYTSSTTFKTVATAKVKNFNDFTDLVPRVSNASSIFKNHFYLITFILIIYFKIIV